MTKTIATHAPGVTSPALVRYPPSVKCSAKSHRTGEPCNNYAIRGGTVCRWHGGQLPTVKKSARENVEIARHELLKKTLDTLIAASPEVAEKLIALATANPDTISPAVLVKAQMAVLDRAGLGPTSKVETENVNISIDAAAVIRARLDRLQNFPPQTVIAGELDSP